MSGQTYDDTNKDDRQLKELLRDISVHAENHKKQLILFVFGITGSGKDTFLNSVYGMLTEEASLQDTDQSREDYIDKVLGDKKYNLTQDFMYVGEDIQITNNLPPPFPPGDHDSEWGMRAETPFNPQSTRGFNIKTFKPPSIIKAETSIINVPGFEPLHSILYLELLKIDNSSFIPLEPKGGHLFIGGDAFYNILKDILESGKLTTNNIYSNMPPQEKLEHLPMVLNQGIFILITLNIMGAILTNYKTIRDFLKDPNALSAWVTDNPDLANDTDDTPTQIFEYVKKEFMVRKEMKDYTTKFGKESSNRVKFPIDKVKLKFLNPFYTEKDRNTEENRFVYFKGGNELYDQCMNPEKNTFIKKLITLLFIIEPEKDKARYNINVVRPLRKVEKVESAFGIGTLKNGKGKRGARLSVLIEADKEKMMLDATLIATLSGFCRITSGDT